ncbi:mechanosensitive ion channel [Candidatus Saccharibacteria bacterium]|nr:mechanosensitive ion channel [Candidatus Saccharibacteria bacterium]
MTISDMAATFDPTTNTFTAPLINGVKHVITQLPSIVFGVLVGILIISIILRLLHFFLRFAVPQIGLRDVIVSTVQIILWLFLVLTVLQRFYPSIVVFFTGSIAAIGIAMAAGGSLLISDIVAGIFLARDVDFNVGDEVKVGEVPTQGIIVGMDARRVRLRSDDGILHIIPNSIVERKEWVLIHRKGELSSLARAAKVIKAATVERVEAKRAQARTRQVRLRKNDQ